MEDISRNPKVEDLKTFLKERDINLSGDKKSQAEKVFGAVTLGLETLPTRATASGTVLSVVKSFCKNAQIMHHTSFRCFLTKKVLL